MTCNISYLEEKDILNFIVLIAHILFAGKSMTIGNLESEIG